MQLRRQGCDASVERMSCCRYERKERAHGHGRFPLVLNSHGTHLFMLPGRHDDLLRKRPPQWSGSAEQLE